MKDKLCINCSHYANTFLFNHYKQVYCLNEKLNTPEVNVVTGEFLKIKEMCLDVRLDENLCGWEGRWWEPRFSQITEKEETKSIAAPTTSHRTARSKGKISLEDLI